VLVSYQLTDGLIARIGVRRRSDDQARGSPHVTSGCAFDAKGAVEQAEGPFPPCKRGWSVKVS
jgi:hypothetical protein